ncbi:sulfite exporter TauE/SafE family protein [Metabacillus idriensis]|uniref:sulfite exporter TauE/SafE family protein n=1 Tax=Metabacillus idriensis TaxID=324768 RepID=UPI001748D305|nr:sulfite exporter TauE/SafE family protein [Metabacillus idriensis]
MSLDIVFMGFLVGGLVGLTGVGGAALLTPLLIFLGINPAIAIGTDFVYNSITKFTAAVQHFRQKTVDFQLVSTLASGSIPSAILANIIFFYFLKDQFNEQLILVFLGAILMIVSLVMLFQLLIKQEEDNAWKKKSMNKKRAVTVMAGIGIGAVVGVTSVGSGSLVALFILYFFNLKASKVVGTDITHSFLIVTVLGIMMIGYGHIDYGLVLNLVLGSIPGTIIGSRLSKKANAAIVRILIIFFILISSTRLLFFV